MRERSAYLRLVEASSFRCIERGFILNDSDNAAIVLPSHLEDSEVLEVVDLLQFSLLGDDGVLAIAYLLLTLTRRKMFFVIVEGHFRVLVSV